MIHLIGVLDADVPVNQLACSADWESWEQQMSRELIALINERSARNDLACECKGSPHDHLSCSFPLSKADNCTIIFHGDYLDFQWGHSKALTPGLAQKRVVATITHTQLENEYGWILCSVSREECKYEYVSRADAVRGLVMRIFPTASPEARARAIKILNKRYLTESPKSTVPRAEHIADMEAERLSVLREVVERPAPKSVKRVATVKSATGAVIPSPPPPTVPKIPRVRVQGPNLKGIAVVKFEYTRHWSGQTSHEIGQAVYLPHGGLHISLQHCSVYVEVLEDDRRLVLRMMQRASNGLHHGGGKTELNILRGWDKNKSASDLDEFLRRFAEHISKYVGVMTDPNTWYHLLTGHEQIKSVRQFTMAMQAKVAEIQGQPTYDVWVVRTGDNVEGVYSTLQNLKDYPGMLDCDGPARYPEGGGYVQQNAPCWAALSVRDSLRLVGAQVEMRDHDPAEAIIGKSTQSE